MTRELVSSGLWVGPAVFTRESDTLKLTASCSRGSLVPILFDRIHGFKRRQMTVYAHVLFFPRDIFPL